MACCPRLLGSAPLSCGHRFGALPLLRPPCRLEALRRAPPRGRQVPCRNPDPLPAGVQSTGPGGRPRRVLLQTRGDCEPGTLSRLCLAMNRLYLVYLEHSSWAPQVYIKQRRSCVQMHHGLVLERSLGSLRLVDDSKSHVRCSTLADPSLTPLTKAL